MLIFEELGRFSSLLYISNCVQHRGAILQRETIQQTEGLFSITSGRKSLTYTLSEELIDESDVKGTIVRMKINLSNLRYVNSQEILQEAEVEAQEKGLVQIASTASKTLKSKTRKSL
ncbi:hypothetical protein HNQ44_001920 [Planomicrobium koreense]|uniref:Uncharacterized protein n=1 Tax=Planococcus koreensis TaxID=112331 RepID=A0A7W8CRV6_9BACL|nr:hypothetical protein [Planococcus koreensis]MBB5180492.1 hypothetical protein [Planococcus koreensis]